MVPDTLPQVMLIKNHDETLVNGSMGRVIRFVDPNRPDEDEQSGAPASKGKRNASLTSPQTYPEVEFMLPNGSRRRMVVIPELSKVELPNGEIQVSRSQVCLQFRLCRDICL